MEIGRLSPIYRAAPVIAGGGAVRFGRYRDGTGWRDWARRAAREALADAGIEPAEVDSLVVASESDFFSLQLSPAAVIADDAGLRGVALTRVEAGGASGAAAVRAAYAQVRAGLARRVLVVGFEQAASHLDGDTVRDLYALSFDADIEGFAGASAATLYALSMQCHAARFGTTRAQCAAVSVKNHGNAHGNPHAHKPMTIAIADVLESALVSEPYHRLDCSLLSDGAAAVVIAAPDACAAGGPRAAIVGSGAASDRLRLGDREAPYRFEAKRLAAAEAYAAAGLRGAGDVQVAEVYDAFTGAELQGIEALGLASEGCAGPRLRDGDFDRDGQVPVNLSGGLIGQGGAPGATGVMQAWTVARIVTGRYHDSLAPPGDPAVGVVDTHGGICTQSVVHVLARID